MNNGYLYVNYSSTKYYYCACSEYSRTDRMYTTEYVNYSRTNRIYTTEYVNYSRTLLFVREVNVLKVKYSNIITAHAQIIHVRIEFIRRNTFNVRIATA